MVLILLEALLALLLLVLIVWWTMFSGRRGGELPESDGNDAAGAPGRTAPRQGDDKTGSPPR